MMLIFKPCQTWKIALVEGTHYMTNTYNGRIAPDDMMIRIRYICPEKCQNGHYICFLSFNEKHKKHLNEHFEKYLWYITYISTHQIP